MKNVQLILCYVPRCSSIPSTSRLAREISACSVGRLQKTHSVVPRVPRPCTDRGRFQHPAASRQHVATFLKCLWDLGRTPLVQIPPEPHSLDE